LIRSHLYLHLSFFFHGFSRFKIKKEINGKCKKISHSIAIVFLLYFHQNLSESTSTTQSETPTDDQTIFDIEKLQNEIEYKEKAFNIIINHNIFSLDANIDDIKSSIDQKRPEQKIYKSSICDLWLRLKTIEQMGPVSLVTFLRVNQLHRTEKQLLEIDTNSIENGQLTLTNPRRSRLIHFHILTESDEFNIDIDSYVGLLIFSYDNQSKFILHGHHCQRGDILIKQMNYFNRTQKVYRGIYDSLFKWYFGHSMDEKFFGIGFIYLNEKWQFDLITYDDKDLFSYEYRIFDLYLFTHWLTQIHLAHNAQEMEINAKNLLLEQFDIVKKKLNEQENTELLIIWNDFIGSNIEDLQLCIEKFNQTVEKEIEIIFKKPNNFSALFTYNI